MRLARARVEALADDDFIVRDHASDARVRLRREEAALRERERAAHVALVGVGERRFGHRGFVIPAKAGLRRQDAEANIREADGPKGKLLEAGL
jgi:hypothetical protein